MRINEDILMDELDKMLINPSNSNIEHESIKYAINLIKSLDNELESYKNPRHWTRSYDYNGDLLDIPALYLPKITPHLYKTKG